MQAAAAAKAKQAKRDGSSSPDTRPRRSDRGDTDRMRDRYRAREERKAGRAARGEPARLEEATSIEEALSAEYEAGKRAGESSRPAPATPPARSSAPASSSSSSGGLLDSLPRSGGVPGVSAPLVVATALITADELVTLKRFPAPSRLLIAWGFFGVLGLARGPAEAPAAALAWGMVVAMFYAKAVKGESKPPALRALDAVGDFLAGGNKTGAAANAFNAPNSSRQPKTGRSPAATPGQPKPYDPSRVS